jgi:hypothetical protein
MRKRLRTLIIALCTAIAAMFVTAPSAMAYAPVDIVHTEQVKVGPYTVVVGFSKWPIRAMQSLDFTFAPTTGITGKSGTLTISGPENQSSQLARHPRERSVWGLDVTALDNAGTYSFTFTITGSQGTGTGTLSNVAVLSQPGPPLPLSWSISSLPAIAMIVFIVLAWRRKRPGRLLAADGL